MTHGPTRASIAASAIAEARRVSRQERVAKPTAIGTTAISTCPLGFVSAARPISAPASTASRRFDRRADRQLADGHHRGEDEDPEGEVWDHVVLDESQHRRQGGDDAGEGAGHPAEVTVTHEKDGRRERHPGQVLDGHRPDDGAAGQEADQGEEGRVGGGAQRLGLETVTVKQPVGDRQVLVRVGERDVEAADDQRQADDQRDERQAERPGAYSSCQGVRMRGPSSVTATVNSKCAASESVGRVDGPVVVAQADLGRRRR